MAYGMTYNEPILLTNLCRNVAATVQEYTQSGGVRPFGISLLVGGVDDGVPALYQIDPSGAYYEWKATAVGKNAKSAKAFLEKRYNDKIEMEDAIHTALLTLKDGYEGVMNGKNIEVGIIEIGGEFHKLSPSQIDDYLAVIE